MVAVVIFKRHLELNLCYDDDEDKLIQGLEDNVIGKSAKFTTMMLVAKIMLQSE